MAEKDADLILTPNADGTYAVEGLGEDENTAGDESGKSVLADDDGGEDPITQKGPAEDASNSGDEDEDDGEGGVHPADTHDADGRALSKTEQNRLSRQRKKNLRNERFEQLQASLSSSHQQITQLQEQLNLLNRRATGSEVVQIDAELEKTEKAYLYHKGVMEAAVTAGRGAEAVVASEKMADARLRYGEVSRLKQAVVAQVSAPGNSQALPDPVVTGLAQAWASKNRWYDPAGQDISSRITRELDLDLTKEKFDPKTAAYWEELDRRVQKHLPHVAAGANMGANRGNGNRPRNTVAGSGREDAGDSVSRSPKGKGFALSAERVQAMKDSGQWDDPKKRNEMTRYYRDYDSKNKG